MPLQTRRPNLPSLTLPATKSSLLMVEDVRTPHTPNPSTPLPFEQGPMVMTPDTPSFDMKPLEIVLGEKEAAQEDWSEEEDGLLQSYLAHPPRALRTAYPPGTLPPPSALDEITTHLINSETRKSPSIDNNGFTFSTTSNTKLVNEDITPTGIIPSSAKWKHSWQSTRQRLFDLARKESMHSIGGHRRQESDSIIPLPAEEKGDAVMKPQRPRLAVLCAIGSGGQKMNRQQHSMDSLYGDEKPQTFQEALRLSSNLQVNAQGENEVLHSGSGLSSPLTFSFNLPTTMRKPFPFSAPSNYLPRPASLLQRGRSFTSEDFAREHSKAAGNGEVDDFALDDIDTEFRPGSPTRMVRPEMHRSVSSPASTLHSSPPSSISSQCEESESIGGLLDVDMAEEAPITPVNQTFSGLLQPGPLGSQCSTPTVSSTPMNPPPLVQPPIRDAPSITLTVNSPEQSAFPQHRNTSRDRASSPSEAFSNLSLGSLPLKLPFTGSASSSPMTSRSISLNDPKPNPSISVNGGGLKRSMRPIPLNRSLSDSGPSAGGCRAGFGSSLSMTSLTAHSERDRENKRQKAIAGMKFGGNGLSVVVPRRSGMLEELRSPFEIKKAF
ncbi:hypothetical protein I302_103923 [Kwoniella bestiolae CBS 10118]|uniref:Uncharacterized protein n=1 Tax=Kwoniella bestiolae CBS 10118 TaxID=1296100 RepID=A0A1B9G9T5_9TREE|nr:hypothetical protein I302_02628 [Kwoniella bestiolae CBS 10118]OCF27779.1 hypothetical protein I302_02628 [Kwoniella bestiolae CBS 10118]